MNANFSMVALLGGIIDYAGTFPPAALPLDEALKKAATFRRTKKNHWLMNKVALNIADLKKITTRKLLEAGADGSPWLYTALGTPLTGTTIPEISSALEWDLREIKHFNDRGKEAPVRQTIVSYENRIADAFLDGQSITQLEHFFANLHDRFEPFAHTLSFFWEIGLEGGTVRLEKSLDAILNAFQRDEEQSELKIGAKIRFGGKTLLSAEEAARALEVIIGRGFRFKATQALHHPVTRGKDLGFVNLFAAITLAQSLGVEKFGYEKIVECLKCEDPAAFSFGADSFTWKSFSLDNESVERARRHHAATFGSCSVDEPDQFISEVFGV